ncbi:hypothetical protein [Actinoplanes rectilineatus]|uniref:hypothetical protein n=1 Tax=Actinoplanes rectilineatus TaxID=113571 RepID=UPI0005F2C457|nr:hypothetical protein [Actinoplanes rectilineatus]
MTSEAGTARRDRRTTLQRLVARGYEPARPPAGAVTVVHRGTVTTGVPDGLPHGGLGVLLPTYVNRCGPEEQAAAVWHVLDRLAPVRAAHPALPLTVWIGMQSEDGDARAIERVTTLLGHLRVPAGLTVAGVALAGRGKLITTNAVLRVTAGLGYIGWLWVDDDVELAPDCLERLVTRFFERGGTGAVGASEVAQVSTTPSARVMDNVSAHTAPPYEYPAAGCMLVAADVVAGGISPRCLTDDGFVLFELLERAPDGGPADFEVFGEARCGFCRIGRAGDTLIRLRRSMYSHVVLMADYPVRAAHWYATRCLFYGLWPVAPWDGRRGIARGLIRWLIKALYLAWFCVVVASLAFRGLAGRPRRSVSWGTDGDFRTALDGTTAGTGGGADGRS